LEEKVLQAQKTTRQALLEPLQEKVEQLVMESDAAKKSIEQIGSEGRRDFTISYHRAGGHRYGRKEQSGSTTVPVDNENV
jgi:hypothetical protein